MAAARETIMQALIARLEAIPGMPTVGRRNRNPETIVKPSQPALILVGDSEKYESDRPNVPPIRRMTVLAILYYDAGTDDNVIPDSVLNPLLDGIDAALTPDNPMVGACTLGGVVQSARIIGEVKKAPGDKTGKGLAIVPIVIDIP